MPVEEKDPSAACTGTSRCSVSDIARSLLVHSTDSFLVQCMRFGIVGAVATVADWVSYILLTRALHVYYLYAQAAGYGIGITVSFALSIKWVFASRTLGHRALDFVVFAAVGVVGLGLTELLIWFFHGVVGLHDLLGKAIATVLVFFWNFGARRYLLFTRAKSVA